MDGRPDYAVRHLKPTFKEHMTPQECRHSVQLSQTIHQDGPWCAVRQMKEKEEKSCQVFPLITAELHQRSTTEGFMGEPKCWKCL